MVRFKILWAPWRIRYILDHSSKSSKEKECFLCKAVNENKDEENLIVFRSKYSFVIMNKYPYNNGHLMVAPYRHVPSLEDLNDEELLDIMKLIKYMLLILRKALNPDGFNIGANLGKCAGAGLEDHVHIHIVPRWIGDTNFMPIVANTKVLPELLSDTYRKLREVIKTLNIQTS